MYKTEILLGAFTREFHRNWKLEKKVTKYKIPLFQIPGIVYFIHYMYMYM